MGDGQPDTRRALRLTRRNEGWTQRLKGVRSARSGRGAGHITGLINVFSIHASVAAAISRGERGASPPAAKKSCHHAIAARKRTTPMVQQ
jgi:hypothetical protein